jgi:hypothetical protein
MELKGPATQKGLLRVLPLYVPEYYNLKNTRKHTPEKSQKKPSKSAKLIDIIQTFELWRPSSPTSLHGKIKRKK